MKRGTAGARLAALPVAREVRLKHVHRGGDEGDHDGDQEAVDRLDAERPEDQPDDEAGGGGEDEAHGGRDLIEARRRTARPARAPLPAGPRPPGPPARAAPRRATPSGPRAPRPPPPPGWRSPNRAARR